MHSLTKFLAVGLFPVTLLAQQLTVREIRYEAALSENEARFSIDIDLEATGKGESALVLFDGEVAVLTSKLPNNWRLVREGNQYRVVASRPGRSKFKLDLVAKITRQEPWNRVTFTGPEAAIASVAAQASGAGVEVQLLSGTLQEATAKEGVTRVRGFLGPDRQVAVRWQSKAAEIARKALLTCETTAAVQVTPTVVKYKTDLRFEILQGAAPRLVLTLPATQALTKLQGEGVRDWQVKPDGAQQVLTIEFIKPVEKSYALTLLSEQTIESAAATVQISPPQPQEVERETGALTVTAEDVLVETDSATGLRQVNAAAGALAAYQFYSRPFTLALKLRRIEPVVNAADRVTVRLEEARLLVTHALTLNVEKAGIYAVELTPPAGFVVADVRGDGIEDWKLAAGKLAVTFSSRVLGSRRVEVQLEQALKVLPEQVEVKPLRVTGAVRETAQIGASAVAGIQLKTATAGLIGGREIAVNRLANRSDEALAYQADQADWKLTVAAERMAARITADVFNLVTIGDGLLGGSATIRYAIINQGVQEFKVKVPGRWKNVEFTGPNIRRKELAEDVWTIGLQEKAWGGYTLVVTYDYQFDPQQAKLDVGGIHCENVERETGSLAITTAANLQIAEESGVGAASPPRPEAGDRGGDAAPTSIYRIDEAELAGNDRALITRPVLMAYRYAGQDYKLGFAVTRFEELPVLDAAADRTQLTTVLTEDGQVLSQASFMVKNNDRQFQTFTLPENAKLWACYVGGEAVKPENNAGKLLVPLPRRANRDQAFAVDIVYKQTVASLRGILPHQLALAAPETDMQTTYAEWELYVPTTQRLLTFGGNMTVARGTTYGLRDAWLEFTRFYDMLYRTARPLTFGFLVCVVIGAVIVTAIRRGSRGLLTLLGLVAILAVLAGMLLPALGSARGKARRSQSMNNLKQIGLGIAQFSADNGGQMPATLDDIKGFVGNEKVFVDVETGERFDYIGAGHKWQEGGGDGIVAYSRLTRDGGNVLFNDGHVEWVQPDRFGELLGRTAMAPAFALPALVAEPSKPTPVQPAAPIIINGGGPPVAFNPPPAISPMVAGIRPIRIDIPKTGQRFVFTKVLNVRAEALAVRALAMQQDAFKVVRGAVQTLAFVVGLVILWWQWRRVQPKALTLAVGMALTGGAVVSLLISWRVLHVALIAAVPVIGFAFCVWVIRKFWRKSGAAGTAATTPVPPIMAGIIFLLLAATTVQADTVTNPVSILSANYTGTVRALDAKEAARAGQFEAVIALNSSRDNETVKLFGEEVAVQEFTAAPSSVKLVRDGKVVSVFLPRKGAATIKMKFLVKTTGDVARRQVAFGIPAALASRVNVTLNEPDAQVEVPTAVSYKITTSPHLNPLPQGERKPASPLPAGGEGQGEGPTGKTIIEAVLGAADRVELNWTPRMKRAADVATTVFCNNAALVTFAGGAVSVRAALDYQITQGELRQLQVKLPAGQRLMRVEGESIRTWKLDGQMLNVELVKGVTPSYRLTVETMKDELGGMKDEGVEIPHAADVKRETGLVALKAADELSVSVVAQQELQKIDVDEFGKVWSGERGATSAYRFLKPEFKLSVRVEPVQPQLEAVVRNQARVTTEQIHLLTVVDYTIKRAGVFTLRLAVPEGYRVERVTGLKIAQWIEKAGQLEVTLKERTLGAYNLTVELSKLLKELPKSLAITGGQVLDVQKVTGFVSVSAEEGVQIKTEAFDGISEVPATLISGTPTGGSVLGFKLIGGETVPAWKLAVTTEKIEAWVRAEVLNTVTLSETLVSGRSVVRYDVANAPTKEFRVRVPAAFRNVEVLGANIRRKDRDEATGEWRVELQNKVRGTFELTVTWDRPWDVKSSALEVVGVEVPGVERETGWVAIVAPARFRVEKKSSTSDMLPIDGRDLPEWAPRSAVPPVLAYRYLRPGFKLALTTQRFEEAEVLQALVDNVRLTTVVSEDGQMMTEMALALRNNARQYLEITLPEGAEVWSAFVAGQPVRPSKRDGKLLLPMERSVGEGTVAVEVTFVGSGRFPRTKGGVELVSPALDVPLKNARWELYLPPDYRYDAYAGSMKFEPVVAVAAGEVAQVVRTYSLGDYVASEQKKEAASRQDELSSVSNARANLDGNNLNQAWQYFNRAKQSQGRRVISEEQSEAKDLKKLEGDLKRVQARNIGQNPANFSGQQTVQGGVQIGQTLTLQGSANGMDYDEATAEKQWEKVQAAQEITVAKAMPLRVNLPKRGVYLAFSQVLQTEVGKPMSVQFAAVNERATGWPTRILMGVAGFVALWGLVTVGMLRRRPL